MTESQDIMSSNDAAPAGPGFPITLAYVALCLLSLLPFALFDTPPIVDFANHAARLSLACGIDDPAVASMYVYRLGIIPNLAVDLVNQPLCGLLSPSAVLRLVTVGALALIYLAGWLIQRRLFGRCNIFLLLLPAMAFNLITIMGYLNFLAGVAVTMILFAAALARRRSFAALLVMGNVGGLIIFYCHIFALAAAMLLFFGLMLNDAGRTVRGFVAAGLRTAALFAVPLLLIPFVPGEGAPLAIDYSGKVRAVIAPFMAQDRIVDTAFLLSALLLLTQRHAFALSRLLWLPLGCLFLYILVVPGQLQDAVDIDARTMVVAVCLTVIGLHPIGHGGALRTGTAVVAGLAVAAHLWVAATTWTAFGREVAELRNSLDVLPAGASLMSVVDFDGEARAAAPIAYSHLASYATIDRRVFNPLEFTGVGMQPLSATPAFAALDTPASLPFPPATARALADPDADVERMAEEYNASFALRWPERIDYVLFYHFGAAPNFDPQRLELVRQGSFFSILKVRRR